MAERLIGFDWAMKKMLRHKANFDILEGFLSELLGFDIFIENILESESNKQDEYDKYNRVDILVKNSAQELMLIEVQNDSQVDYFQRMMYGVSKLITEYIKEGDDYAKIKKVYSINIVYFNLGKGKDYIYEYKGEFIGVHTNQILLPTISQNEEYNIQKVSDLFPKYYILRVNNFNKVAENTLDEWIYFLKNSEVKDEFKAKGLAQAKEKMKYEKLSPEEKIGYNIFQKNIRIQKSVLHTAQIEASKKARKQGKEEGKMGVAKIMKDDGFSFEIIARATGLSIKEIEKL
ncbi:MAG: Rpn family recombination-promoting nuclease/putative transposase [Bacteroidetes bacterium]|nr:MAG: Rpn family recombination-promoting nuclease/putative transposase [Bacteroidota bacterium]